MDSNLLYGIKCINSAGSNYTQDVYDNCVELVSYGELLPDSSGRPRINDVWEQATAMIGEIFGFGPWDQYILADDKMSKGIDYALSNLSFEQIQNHFIEGVNKKIISIYAGTLELEEWKSRIQ